MERRRKIAEISNPTYIGFRIRSNESKRVRSGYKGKKTANSISPFLWYPVCTISK
jgi:hypothetical protein